jgi:phytoene synthase
VTDLAQAYEECRLVARREAKNFYYAFLTLPPEKRRAFYAAYTFCRYCDDSVDSLTSDDEKLGMLGELRRKLSLTYQGQALVGWAGSAEDSVFLCLADVARQYEIPEEYFREVLAGVESDLVKHRYQNFEELRQYCYRVASVVGLICLQIVGYKDPRARDYAIDLGLAMQLTNIIRDVQEDLDLGRIYLPLEELAQFGYSEADLQAGRVNESFTNLMRFQAQRARHYFDRGFMLLPYLSPRTRACPAVLGQIYNKVLDRIESADYDVLHHRISLSTSEKVRVMAQTWLTSLLPVRTPSPMS